MVEFFDLTDVRTVAFAKSAVEAMALELGYSPDDYDVRFTFVPIGADGSFDYAITLTDDEASNAPIVDTDVREIFVGVGETVRMEITPDSDTEWSITSVANGDTYASLLDADGNRITYNDDDGEGNQFLINYTLEAGKTYYLEVRWYSSSNSGYFHVLFSATPVTE